MILLVSEGVYHEMNFFLAAVLTGIVLKAAGDCLNLFRAVCHHGKLVTALEDLTYWVIAAIAVFVVAFLENDGLIRGFSMLGILIGVVFWKITLGKFFQYLILKTLPKQKKNKKGLKKKRKIGKIGLHRRRAGGGEKTDEQKRQNHQTK